MQETEETQVQSLGQKDPLEQGVRLHFLYPTIHWRTLRLFSYLDHYEYCYSERGNTDRYFFVLSKILMYVYHWTSNFLFLSVKGQWLSLYINLHFISLKSPSGQIIGCGIAGKKLKILTMELSLKAETQLFGTLLLGTGSRMTLECIRSSKYVQTVNQLSSPRSRRRLVPRGTGFLSPRSSRSIRARVAWCSENRAWGQTASSPTDASLCPLRTPRELRQPNEMGSLPQEAFCGFRGSEWGTWVKKWDFIVLTAEVRDAFKSFLSCNRLCAEQDHKSISAEAIWSARKGGQTRANWLCVSLVEGWNRSGPAGTPGWRGSRSLPRQKKASLLATSFPWALPKIPIITFFSPCPHIACLGFGVCLNGSRP